MLVSSDYIHVNDFFCRSFLERGGLGLIRAKEMVDERDSMERWVSGERREDKPVCTYALPVL